MQTNRMLECYCRINATADDAATAWSIKHAGFIAKRAKAGFLHRIAVHAGTMNPTGEAIKDD